MSHWLGKRADEREKILAAKKAGTMIEFDLGPNDILLIETDENLSTETCKRLKDEIERVLKTPGRIAFVLSSGLRAKTIHRSGFVTNIINVPASKAND